MEVNNKEFNNYEWEINIKNYLSSPVGKMLLNRGYTVINKGKEEDLCNADKWIIKVLKDNRRENNLTYIDFSVIENEELRYEFKKYLAEQDYVFLDENQEKKYRYIFKAASAINSYTREFFLKDFIKSELYKFTGYTPYIYHFVEFFEESLVVENIVCDWSIFSVDTILNQKKNFIEKCNGRNNTDILSCLTKYYKFLIKDKGLKIFSKKDGVTLEFLEKNNFLSMLEDGYRVVFSNQFDEIPKHDKWLLDSSSSTIRSTALSHKTLVSLDFTSIKSIKYRHEVKKWIMGRIHQIKTLKTYLGYLAQFLNLLESGELDTFKGNVYMLHQSADNQDDITTNQVILYCQYLDRQGYSGETIAAKKFAVRQFLEMLKKDKYKISNNVFNYLKSKNIKKGMNKVATNRTVIIQEDLKKIYDKLKEKARDDDTYKLMWGFIYLLNTTKLRNSEILSLTRDCVIDGMKDGDKSVRYLRKISAGYKVEEEPLSKNAVRIIEKMKDLTNELSKSEHIKDDELKNCIFLRNYRGHIKRLENDTFYRKFKSVLESLGIDRSSYTLYDFRHTYMTNLFESSINKGETWKVILATGHLDRKTTLKNYVKPHINSYLEAMYKVNIGNVSVKGEVVEHLSDAMNNIPDNIKEIQVKDKCGYCKGECDENNIDCLLCANFVVTLDRLPYFVDYLKELDKIIYSESIHHEKEHLLTIKKLYVAYIAKIQSLKEDLGDINEG